MRRISSILKPISIGLCIVFVACGGNEPQQPLPKKKRKDQANKESMVEINKRVTEAEALQIDKYVKRHGLKVITTATGLRYDIYKKAPGKPPMPKKNQVVLIHFTSYLLDGKEIYSSLKGQPVEVVIDRDNVESGVHEGLKYMHVGDKAKFILPSHLAHGIMGDNDKIPPLTPVVYNIELLSIQ
jgi:FKBP-type peptidyl-prolyl cis-trans isomerase FkpA